MAISDFQLPTEEVLFPNGGSFAVRGLSLQDITLLLGQHGSSMESFFDQYNGNKDQSAMDIGMNLVGKAPSLVAQIIASAADEPDMATKIIRFPIVVQQDALEKIARLTFDASGGPGKFVEAVMGLVQGTTNLMSKLPR
jgi:hypothetical protein